MHADGCRDSSCLCECSPTATNGTDTICKQHQQQQQPEECAALTHQHQDLPCPQQQQQHDQQQQEQQRRPASSNSGDASSSGSSGAYDVDCCSEAGSEAGSSSSSSSSGAFLEVREPGITEVRLFVFWGVMGGEAGGVHTVGWPVSMTKGGQHTAQNSGM